MKNDTSMSPAETAQKLNVTIGYVYGLLWVGKMKGEKDKVTGKWRIPQSEIDIRLRHRKKKN